MDFRYWTKYARLKTDKGRVEAFNLWPSQEYFLSKLAAEEKRQWEAWQGRGGAEQFAFKGRFIWVKSRQVGGTRLAQMINIHIALTFPNTYSLVASDTPEKGLELWRLVDTAYSGLPFFLRPGRVGRVKGSEHFFEGLGSTIVIGAGNQKASFGQGVTVDTFHLCVAPNTLVRVDNGTLLPISEVEEGATVLTHTGALARVKRKILSPRRNELTTELWPRGSFAPIVTTRDHRIWTDQGWKEARDIQSGDLVVYPVRPIRAERATIEFSTRRPGGLGGAAGKFYDTTMRLDRRFGYVLGMYLAEGTIQHNNKTGRPGSTCFAVHHKEVPDLVRRVQELFPEKHVGSTLRRNSLTGVVRLGHTGFARWLKKEFGCTDSKRFPDWAWEAGEEFCLGLLEGYLDGDGHYDKDGASVLATSVRAQLLIQARDLAASLGFGWGSIYYRPAGLYYQRNCRESWTLHFSGEASVRLRERLGKPGFPAGEARWWEWVEGGIGVVVDVVGEGFSETFYDLEVDSPDHSFAGVSAVMHNSEASTWLPEVAALIDTDLFWAFDSSRKLYSIGMIESTAQGGTGNWFGQQWEQSVKGRSLFIPIFLGWFMTPEKWRLDDPRIIIRPETEALGKRITERFPEFTPDKTQLAWYQTRRDEMASKGKLGEFLEEVPSFPEEAFEHGVQSIFSIETRDRVRAGVKKPPVVKRWEEGEAVKAEWDGDPESADDLILFWEPPERGGVYVVAVDGAHGKETGDSHAIEVLKAGEKVEQVAEWTHRGGGLLGLGRVAEIASYLGYLYRNQAEDRPAVIAPESNPGSPSAYVTLKLLEEGYPNIYIHRRAAKIRGEQLKEDVGWQTNEATRSPLVSKGKEAVEGGSLVIRSERALEELRHFTRVWSPGGRVKFEHAPGKHDDALIALFIGNWVATDDLVRVEASEAERADLALARTEKGVEGGGFRIMLGVPPAEKWTPQGAKTNIWGDVW